MQHEFSVGQWQVDSLGNTLSQGSAIKHVEPKAIWVLRALADRPGAIVTRRTLLDEVWQGRQVGDEVLSRCISLLRGALGDDPKHPGYIQTVPGVGYRLVAQVSVPDDEPVLTALAIEPTAAKHRFAETPASEPCFALDGRLRLCPRLAALVVAIGFWIVQSTEALHADAAPAWLMSLISTLMMVFCSAWVADVWLHMSHAGGKSHFVRPLSRVNRIDLGFMAIALATLVFALMSVPGETITRSEDTLMSPSPAVNTIAVLPFRRVGSISDIDYFVEGLADEVATRLAPVVGLRIVARDTASAPSDSEGSALLNGRRLGASKLVTGTVRVDGRKLRISVQLVDANNGLELWADSYDVTLEDLFVEQDSIATSIVKAVVPKLAPLVGDTEGASAALTRGQIDSGNESQVNLPVLPEQ